MPFRHTALALLGLAILTSTPASAQTSSAPLCVGGQAGTGQAQIAIDCPSTRTLALSEFRFGFYNGDHRFRQATLMPAGDHFTGAWADVNGDDPWFVEGRWYRIPEAQGGVISAVVQGYADIPIPAGPPNTTLVISGFEFKRADGTEANIRTIGIDTDSAAAEIRVVLLDDQGPDFTQLARGLAAGLAFGALGVPDPNLSFAATGASNTLFVMGRERLQPGVPSFTAIPAETPAPAPAASGGNAALIPMPGLVLNVQPRPVKVSDNNARPYRVSVAYLWVPNNRLAQNRPISGGERNRASGALPGNAPHVLHSFFFNFDNSDHFIGGFGVHLSGGAPFRGDEIGADQLITWEDANRDDPITWRARISNLVDAPAPSYRAVTPATARVVTMAPVTVAPATTAPASSTPPAESTPAAEEEEAAPAGETPAERRARRRAARGE